MASSAEVQLEAKASNDGVTWGAPQVDTIIRDEDGNPVGVHTGAKSKTELSFCDKHVYEKCCNCEDNACVGMTCCCCGCCAPFCCGITCAPKDDYGSWRSPSSWLCYFHPFMPCGLTKCGIGCSRELICSYDDDQ